MRQNIKLSTGRTVAHKPYLSGGKPNGATEAYILGGGNMTDEEWEEYCKIIAPKPVRKLTWEEIKASRVHV